MQEMKKRILKPRDKDPIRTEDSSQNKDLQMVQKQMGSIIYRNNLAMPATEQTTERESSSSQPTEKGVPPSTYIPRKNSGQEQIRFGTIFLSEFPDIGNRKFKPFPGLNLDRSQQCLLDNLWHIQTIGTATTLKVQCLNALSMYFSENNPKIHKKKFTHYVIFRGLKTGVFHNFNTVKNYILCDKPIFVGYHSFSEALEEARAHLGVNFFIEPEEVRPYADVAREEPSQLVKRLEDKNRKLEEQMLQLQTQTHQQLTFLENQKIGAEKQRDTNNETVSIMEKMIKKLNNTIKELRTQLDEASLKLQKTKEPNRSFINLKARILDLPSQKILQPLFEHWPEGEEILKKKSEESHIRDLIDAQKELIKIYFREDDDFAHLYGTDFKFKGVKIIQKPYSIKNKTVGLFKLQINLNKTDLPKDRILKFFHFGMIDQIDFKLDEEGNIEEYLEWFGEKFFIIGGNMAVRKKIICMIDSTLPKVTNFVTIPAKKKIIILTDDGTEAMEDDSTLLPYDFQDIENEEIYRLLQNPRILPTPKHWKDLRLLGEGHYTQIYSTDEWRMHLPHSGDGSLLDEETIVNLEDEKLEDVSMSSGDVTIPETHRDL